MGYGRSTLCRTRISRHHVPKVVGQMSCRLAIARSAIPREIMLPALSAQLLEQLAGIGGLMLKVVLGHILEMINKHLGHHAVSLLSQAG